MTKNMKLRLYTAAALVAIVGLASCAGDDNKEYVDKSIMPTAEEKAAAAQNAATNTAVPATNVMPANLQQPVNVQQSANQQQPGSVITMPGGKTITVPGGGPVAITPVAGQGNAAPQNNVVMTQNPQVVQPTAPGMNPPHGQPNHRCDIAVGAPLNSKPAPATTGTTGNAQPQVTMTEVANKVKTAPGMNPPHGEPNHRCDIAVGAPLNSKPAPVTTTPAATPAAAPLLLTAPKTDSTKN
jgi:hypothetical protein